MARRAIAALCLVVATRTLAGAQTMRVEVTDEQRASVAGQGSSLRAVLEELCWRAGASFRYDDVDEPLAAALDEQPLPAVLERLLRGRSYVLTLRHDAAGDTRVSALHVLGHLDGEWIRAPRNSTFTVPETMLTAVFGAPDTKGREAAVQDLVRSVSSDPERLRAFLASDTAAMGEVLRRYPEASAVLRQISDTTEDPAIQAKLAALLVALE